jgi:hypothetical protein
MGRPRVAAGKKQHCGATPIAARSVAGWSLACPNDKAHGYLFEQWIEKCRRRWAVLHAAERQVERRRHGVRLSRQSSNNRQE